MPTVHSKPAGKKEVVNNGTIAKRSKPIPLCFDTALEMVEFLRFMDLFENKLWICRLFALAIEKSRALEKKKPRKIRQICISPITNDTDETELRVRKYHRLNGLSKTVPFPEVPVPENIVKIKNIKVQAIVCAKTIKFFRMIAPLLKRCHVEMKNNNILMFEKPQVFQLFPNCNPFKWFNPNQNTFKLDFLKALPTTVDKLELALKDELDLNYLLEWLRSPNQQEDNNIMDKWRHIILFKERSSLFHFNEKEANDLIEAIKKHFFGAKNVGCPYRITIRTNYSNKPKEIVHNGTTGEKLEITYWFCDNNSGTFGVKMVCHKPEQKPKACVSRTSVKFEHILVVEWPDDDDGQAEKRVENVQNIGESKPNKSRGKKED